jgi:hypothetical protein
MVLPIRRALTKTIRDALDVYHNVVFDTQVHIQQLAKLGVNVNELLISVVLVVTGFLVYYLIPLTFAYERFDIFFRIMTSILLGLLSRSVPLIRVVILRRDGPRPAYPDPSLSWMGGASRDLADYVYFARHLPDTSHFEEPYSTCMLFKIPCNATE